jgi:hypothetical protein
MRLLARFWKKYYSLYYTADKAKGKEYQSSEELF